MKKTNTTLFVVSMLLIIVSFPYGMRIFFDIGFGAVDTLAYTGAIVGGLITLTGGMITINHSNKAIWLQLDRENKRQLIETFPKKMEGLYELKELLFELKNEWREKVKKLDKTVNSTEFDQMSPAERQTICMQFYMYVKDFPKRNKITLYKYAGKVDGEAYRIIEKTFKEDYSTILDSISKATERSLKTRSFYMELNNFHFKIIDETIEKLNQYSDHLGEQFKQTADSLTFNEKKSNNKETKKGQFENKKLLIYIAGIIIAIVLGSMIAKF